MQVRRILIGGPLGHYADQFAAFMAAMATSFREFAVEVDDDTIAVTATVLRTDGDLDAALNQLVNEHLGDWTSDLDELLASPGTAEEKFYEREVLGVGQN